jgi:hypothetical protein
MSSQRLVTSFTATASQTTFTPTNGYVVGYVDVYYNGVKLIVGDDYTASNGVTVVLTSPAGAGDSVELVAYKPSGLSDGYTKSEADARYEPIDSAYTKAESDARYAQEGANTDITSISGITGGVGTPDYVDFDTAATITPAVGRLGWDPDTGSLQMGMAGGNVFTHVGQTMHAYVTNAESVTINKGQPVYLYQAQGDRATVKLAGNTSDATSAKTLGLAAENIAAGQIGYVICQGVLNNVNTAAFNAGDTLYLGATVGTLTATKPVAPNHLVYIGVVERANAGAGQIYVRPQNGYELDEIHDVLITSEVDGQVLTYESATGLWKNKTVATALGFTPENVANKGVANGYASLDGSGKVPSTQLPSYVDDVLEYANLATFPATGETGKIYVTLDTNKTYRWSGSAYVEIASSPGSTDAVTEGTTNLYFTQARARTSVSASGSLSYNSSTGVFSFTDAVTSVAGKTGVVTLTNSDVGLGNVENKSSATIRGELTSANVTTALGFTPSNKAGDTFTGEVKMPNAYFGDPAYERNANTFEWGGSSASFGLNVQDGMGRVNWYWNSNGTSVPTQTVANEDAYRLNLGVDSPTLEFHGWEGSTSPAGTAITWTSIFRASMAESAPTFKGNTLLHAANYSSYALPLSGGTMTGSVEVTSGQNVRFGHPSQSDGNDGKIGAGLYATGLNIVGTQTAAGGGRIIRLFGSLLTDGGLVYIHSGNIGSYASGGTPTLNVTSSTSVSAAASNHYVLTGGATTVTLPASPAAGAVVWVTVANGRVDNVIARNGQNINSLAENMTIDQANAGIQLRYADATRGWIFT